jgi:hypothetical protein
LNEGKIYFDGCFHKRLKSEDYWYYKMNIKLGVLVHACNASTWEAEAQIESSRSTQAT